MKSLLLIVLAINVLAGGGSYVDTTRVVDLRQYSGGIVDTMELFGSGSDSDTTRVLNIGDYLQINNKNEYVIKTVSRHLIVDDFKLVNKFKVINKKIKIIRKDLEETLEEYTTDDILHNLDTTIKPFEVDDF